MSVLTARPSSGDSQRDSSRVESPAGQQQRVEMILAQIDQLPTLPTIALRVLEATQSSTSALKAVAELISTDPSLTARILALVRRAHVGVRADYLTVLRAVVLLGLETVRSAVLSIKVFDTFSALEPGEGAAFDRTEFWKHSFAVACAARQLTSQAPKGSAARRISPEQAFIAGLLHDLGKIALDACLPKSYARVVKVAAARRVCLCDLEREFFGVDHMVVGRRLALRWKLPSYVPDVCWLHHHPIDALPASIQFPGHIAVVHLADQWVRRQRLGYSGHIDFQPLAPLAEKAGVDERLLDELMAPLIEQVEQQCAVVGLGEVSTVKLYNRALADANEELSRLNLALTQTSRRLHVRTRGVDAVAQFTGRLSVTDDLLDVCRAAASSWRELLSAPLSAVFVCPPRWGSQLCTMAWEAADRAGSDVFPLPGDCVPRATTETRPIEPPAWSQLILEHCRMRNGNGDDQSAINDPQSPREWRMLPIVHGGELLGGVCFTVSAESPAAEERDESTDESLLAALGLALAGAISRADAGRLHEELATAHRQLRQAQDQLLRTRSLSMIAEMAAGAAHELNNPLAVISGRAQMLAMQFADPQDRQAVEVIHEQAVRCSQIVTELMAFAKPASPSPARVALSALLQPILRQWLDSCPLSAAQLTWHVADPAVTIYADISQVTTILDALIANALQATRPETARVHVNSLSRGSDETVVISVEDNGVGMTPEVAEHALDPFFSYRPAGRGRGLGLSKAHRLSEINGGRLWLESTPGKGTTVWVELPARPR
ncbi:MAG TPA: HDOD domain-containing protein [Phycisphaerae bacterium]|jgi:signal transduction histidine kinase/HD-like signal output (HDOD) protein